jgi:hypothetical protein
MNTALFMLTTRQPKVITTLITSRPPCFHNSLKIYKISKLALKNTTTYKLSLIISAATFKIIEKQIIVKIIQTEIKSGIYLANDGSIILIIMTIMKKQKQNKNHGMDLRTFKNELIFI